MGVVLAMAKATYRESIRQRVLLVVLLLGLLLIAVSVAFSYLSTGEEFRFVVDFGLVGITLVGLGLAVILGGFMIPNEVERRVIFTVLTKPVSRMQYILGKFLGACAVIFVIDLLVGLAFVAAYAFKHPQGWQGLSWMVPMAIFAIYLQTTILLAVALMLSTLASPVFTMIATGFVYIIGAVNSSVTYLGNRADSLGTRLVFSVLSKLIPAFNNFDLRPALLNDQPIQFWPYLGQHVLLYTVFYVLVMLSIAWLLFNEREF
ncbi:MAG: ABC transporter permease [Armatimonadetes bacterium]|nr:ABC transporter permease [Armatimonadota bacterium]